jgi:hypothetical protein
MTVCLKIDTHDGVFPAFHLETPTIIRWLEDPVAVHRNVQRDHQNAQGSVD